MSNFSRPAYNPKERVIRDAMWYDDYFAQHEYGVVFVGDSRAYRTHEVEIPTGVVFVPSDEGT